MASSERVHVIGAGLAGLAAATRLARAGRQVIAVVQELADYLVPGDERHRHQRREVGEAFVFRGVRYHAWLHRDLAKDQTFGVGSFSQDARGRWYLNLPVEVETLENAHGDAIGIDLGLSDLATISTGEKVEAPRWYRKQQERLAVAQRANKKRQAKKIHVRAANQRKDHLHKLSNRLVQSHGAIFVGNVNAAGLAKTKMAKSVLDAGWSMFRQQLAYKAIRHGVFR